MVGKFFDYFFYFGKIIIIFTLTNIGKKAHEKLVEKQRQQLNDLKRAKNGLVFNEFTSEAFFFMLSKRETLFLEFFAHFCT